jgi:hypothetical protein
MTVEQKLPESNSNDSGSVSDDAGIKPSFRVITETVKDPDGTKRQVSGFDCGGLYTAV